MSVDDAIKMGRRLRRACGLARQDSFPFEAFTLDVQKLLLPEAELVFFSEDEANHRYFKNDLYLATSFGQDRQSTRKPRIEAVYRKNFESDEQRQWSTFGVAHEFGHILLRHTGVNNFTASQRDFNIAAPGTTSGIGGAAMQGRATLSDKERKRAWDREIEANTFAVYFLSNPGEIIKFRGLQEWANWFDIPPSVALAFKSHFISLSYLSSSGTSTT